MALDLWAEFFDELQNVRGRSQNTVMAYRRDLEVFERFKEKHSDISMIYSFLQKNGLSTRSQARVISSLRTYFKFCESRGLDAPELRELRPPKVKAKLPRALTLNEYEKLFAACLTESPEKSARNQMTLLLLFGLGCRVSELISLDLKDWQVSDGTLRLTGKGQKERLVPLTEKLREELRLYVSVARPSLLKGACDSILINDRGKRPSRVDIWRWLSAWSAKAGFDYSLSPHQFRHGCATALLEGGADLKTIQSLLGHTSIQTTQIYTSVSTKHLESEVKNHHPLSK